jgi:cytochrome c peroxidase
MLNFPLSKKLKRIYIIPILLFCAVVVFFWQYSRLDNPSISPIADSQTAILVNEPIQPIPLEIELDADKVELGNLLFHDPQLSSDNTVSCASCHDLARGGVDRLPTSLGMGNSTLTINSPTVFNSGLQFKQNWDGRAETLEEQAEGPLSSAGEMGGLTGEQLIEKLKKSSQYQTLFKEVYSNGITFDNVTNALGEFQRSLYTPNAPFDRYLRGNPDAITAEEKRGYDLFKSYGCVTCHQGMLVGGNMFQTFGIMGDYFGDRGNIKEADLGRYNVTKNERDRHVFKVPMLRNITKTAPYFHDGTAETLDEAIKVMAKYQLGIEMPQEDVDSIMLFLRTLEGEYQGEPV